MLRALSPVEHAFWLLDRSAAFNGVNTSFLRGPIEAEQVRRALAAVQARHPLLRVAIGGEPPAFLESALPVPLRVLPRTSPDLWKQCEEEEINGHWQEGELLWRAVWLQGEGEGELLITHQHVIADAQAAVMMAREVVLALADVVSGRRPDAQPRSPRPPLTDLLRERIGLLAKLWAMHAFFFRNQLFHGLRPARKLTERRDAFAARRSRVVHLSLDERATATLASRCRSEGTTMQGGLCAALLLAAADELALDRRAWLGCFSTISLREPLDLGGDMGLYISQVATYHRVSRATRPWPLAREVKRDLRRVLASGEQLVSIPMIGMLIPRSGDAAARLAQRLDLASPATVGLSNVGRVELPRTAGPVSLDAFHLAVAPSVVAPLAACAATVHGRLHLSLVHVDPLFVPAQARALLARAAERIEEACL